MSDPRVQHIVTQLAEVYTEEGVQVWLNARNRNLDMARPIDLIKAGQFDEVGREVDLLTGGGW